MKNLFFFVRLSLYLFAFSLPIIHPAIVVPYDRIGMIFWFFVLPIEMVFAFYLAPPRLELRKWLYLLSGTLLSFIFVALLFQSLYPYYVIGTIAAVVLTVLIFKTNFPTLALSIGEQFFLAFLYFKLLSFSRSSESTAQASSGITQILLILAVSLFFLHGLILFFSTFHKESGRKRVREIAVFLAIAVPAVLLVTFLLPPDFVRHSIVLNRINRDAEPRPFPTDIQGDGWPGGNLQPEDFDWRREYGDRGGGQEPGESEDGEGQLEGIPSDQWGSFGMGGENKQYAVMVVASPEDPVYLAGAYFGSFDPVLGFTLSDDNSYNELSYSRLLETWRDNEYVYDRKRAASDIYLLSTLPERYLAYRPFLIEPTVLKREFHPFEFSYNTVSRISASRPRDWRAIRGLNEEQKQEMRQFLEIPLEEEDRVSFEGYLNEILDDDDGYFERAQTILESYSTHQYELGFDDRVHVEKMERFLLDIKRGDCTEFSNTTAILARLAGIPSRVVTGYLAAKDLQTPVHFFGLMALREKLEPIQDYPVDDLYLVTSAHRHSWVQFYMPPYGWVDFETTAYAVPPPPGGDLNNMDVVIPIIEDVRIDEKVFVFPWRMVLRVLFFGALVTLAILYLYRYSREAYLSMVSRRDDDRGLRALLKLLLIKLASNGYEVKQPSETALEYADRHPELTEFSGLYTRLRYRTQVAEQEKKSTWGRLRELFAKRLNEAKKSGIGRFFRRLFSLRSLLYK